MNLQQIRDLVGSLSDYRPDNPQYIRDVTQLINQAYKAIWNTQDWTFKRRQATFPISVDITEGMIREATGATREFLLESYAPSQPASAQVTLFAKADFLFVDENEPHFGLCWIGQILNIEGVDYTIRWIQVQENLSDPSDYRYRIDLDRPVRPALVQTNNFVFKYVNVWLPEDLQDIYAVAYRPTPVNANPGWIDLHPLNTYEAARFNQWVEETGPARNYLRVPDLTLPAGGRLEASIPENSEEYTQEYGILSGTTLKLCWAYIGEGGNIGPLGEPLVYTVPPPAEGETGWDVQLRYFSKYGPLDQGDTAVNYSGRNQNRERTLPRVLLFDAAYDPNKPEREPYWQVVPWGCEFTEQTIISNIASGSPPNLNTAGAWLFTSMLVEPYYTTGTILKSVMLLDERISNRYNIDSQRIKFIQMYPRPTAPTLTIPQQVDLGQSYQSQFNGSRPLPAVWKFFVSLTYTYHPQELLRDEETPDVPPEFAYAIAYRVLHDLMVKNGDLQKSQYFWSKYDSEIKSLEKRYRHSSDSRLIKGIGTALNRTDRDIVRRYTP